MLVAPGAQLEYAFDAAARQDVPADAAIVMGAETILEFRRPAVLIDCSKDAGDRRCACPKLATLPPPYERPC
jgi:hypothetical protein